MNGHVTPLSSFNLARKHRVDTKSGSQPGAGYPAWVAWRFLSGTGTFSVEGKCVSADDKCRSPWQWNNRWLVAEDIGIMETYSVMVAVQFYGDDGNRPGEGRCIGI